VRTTLKRLRFLDRARAAETAALDIHDPEAIELAAALATRALELVDDLTDDLEEAVSA
jgi:hypothetical protein